MNGRRACAVLAFAATHALAQAGNPLAGADAAAGKALAEKDCVACHVQRFGAADTIYTRPDRRVTTRAQLIAQVQVCNTQLKSNYFPEDEANVAAYLDQRYYRFPP